MKKAQTVGSAGIELTPKGEVVDHGKVVKTTIEKVIKDSLKMGKYIYHGTRPIYRVEYEDGYVTSERGHLAPSRATWRDKNKYSKLYTG